MTDHNQYELIGETLDDAAGEAYDKVARILNLPYPGGHQSGELASEHEASINFPRAWLNEDSFDFSFSGLKSAVANYVHNAKQRNETINKGEIAASFQASVVDVLTEKTYRVAYKYTVKQMILDGC